jgi:hypothetical protein
MKPVDSAGTGNAIYRLGDDMCVRLPRIHGATGQVQTVTAVVSPLLLHFL